jgi:hypothetical protein
MGKPIGTQPLRDTAEMTVMDLRETGCENWRWLALGPDLT